MDRQPADTRRSAALGPYLRSLRELKGWTLRTVEEASGGDVSNAYLSQLENGRISKPSPNILHSLAAVYGVPYETLMAKAGYLSPKAERSEGERHGAAATSAPFGDLTTDEENALLAYLAMYRKTRGDDGR